MSSSFINFTIASDTYYNLDYTFHYDKISCVRQMYFVHIVLAYFIALSGLGCLVTRLIPSYAWLHVWFGRIYLFSMLWCTATSLLIHNSGLPLAVLISFLWVLGGLTIGCFVIYLHQIKMNKMALANILTQVQQGKLNTAVPLDVKLAQEKSAIAQNKTWKQRMFSYKALHGAVMVTSYINIVGRIFASNQSGDFTCHTYPVYKPIENPSFKAPAGFTNTSIYFLEGKNPTYNKLPWANKEGTWGAILVVAPMLGSLAIGALVAYFASKKAVPVKEGNNVETIKV